MKSATLGQASARQVWPEKNPNSTGIEKLWYTSENMQKHMPSDPFYVYVANSMNGTGTLDVAHHSLYAMNFAKFLEMGDHGGHQYTVYYTDFAHMTEADRGMERYEVMRPPPGLTFAPAPAASPVPAPAAMETSSLVLPPGPQAPGPEIALSAGQAPAPAPGPASAPAFEVANPTVFN